MSAWVAGNELFLLLHFIHRLVDFTFHFQHFNPVYF